MASRNAGQVFPDPDDFRIHSSTLGRKPSPAVLRAARSTTRASFVASRSVAGGGAKTRRSGQPDELTLARRSHEPLEDRPAAYRA